MPKSNTKQNTTSSSATDTILDTDKAKPMSKIDKDALLSSTVAIGVELKAANTKASEARISANDLAFLFVVHLIALFSNNRNKTATLWPGRGGIRKTLNTALKDAGIKKKAADRYMAVASIVEMHQLAIPANSTVGQVQSVCTVYGWDTVSKIQAAFANPIPWNADCTDMLTDWQANDVYKAVVASHDDSGEYADNAVYAVISKIVFHGMDKQAIADINEAKRVAILPLAKQQDAYDKAQQAAQLAEIEKQAKQ